MIAISVPSPRNCTANTSSFRHHIFGNHSCVLFHKIRASSLSQLCVLAITLVCVLVVEKGKLLQHLDISPRFSCVSHNYICRDKHRWIGLMYQG